MPVRGGWIVTNEPTRRTVIWNVCDYCSCYCYPKLESPCVCGEPEKSLRGWISGSIKTPMTEVQREWCLSEIDSVEGYVRKDYEASKDDELARGVICAWRDYARDKGLAC